MQQLDKQAKKQGRTLDLSSGSNTRKLKRIYRPRDPGDPARKGTPRAANEAFQGSLDYAYPQSVLDYGKFVQSLRQF